MQKHEALNHHHAYQLLLTCALAIAPFLFDQHWSFTSIAVALLIWRTWLTRSRQPLPSRLLLLSIGFFAVVLAFWQYHTILGRGPGLALLSLLLPLKLLETRSTRDARAALLLCCFLLTGQFLVAQSALMALLVFACTLAILTTTATLQQPGLSPRTGVVQAGKLLLTGIPLMVVLFLLFPRISGPLWSLPSDAAAGKTGLSDSMTPGSISELIQSGEIAFRASFQGPRPAPAQLYWRGPVLSRFDGRSWSAERVFPRPAPTYQPEGEHYTYTLTLEANDQPWLLALDYPAPGATEGEYMSDLSLRSPQPVSTRKRYTLTSYPKTRVGLDATAQTLAANLRLPPQSNPRTQTQGKALATANPLARQRVMAGIEFLRQAHLAYTLYPPRLGPDSADEFLFDTKRGFCEHFASAFVVMMRAAGVPARVVTGYQGGELNPVDQTLVVRQSDAHAWAEVWLQDQGWVRVDPTAASAPERIDLGISGALPLGEALPLSLRADFPVLAALRHRWEALSNGWNQWVLGYNASRQLDFIRALGLKDADWRTMIFLLLGCIALWTGILVLRWLPKRPRIDPLDRVWLQFCTKLARAELKRYPWEAPGDFARRAAQRWPEHAAAITTIAEAYATLRYAPQSPAAAQLVSLKTLIRDFDLNRT